MSFVKRFRETRGRIRKMPTVLQTRVRENIEETVREGAARGRELIAGRFGKRSGKMRRFYRARVSRSAKVEGRFGYITARARRQVFYARFLHDGTRYILGYPFHDIVTEELGPRHRRRMRDALRRTIRGAP